MRFTTHGDSQGMHAGVDQGIKFSVSFQFTAPVARFAFTRGEPRVVSGVYGVTYLLNSRSGAEAVNMI